MFSVVQLSFLVVWSVSFVFLLVFYVLLLRCVQFALLLLLRYVQFVLLSVQCLGVCFVGNVCQCAV